LAVYVQVPKPAEVAVSGILSQSMILENNPEKDYFHKRILHIDRFPGFDRISLRLKRLRFIKGSGSYATKVQGAKSTPSEPDHIPSDELGRTS
jgi:hypothetical protein